MTITSVVGVVISSTAFSSSADSAKLLQDSRTFSDAPFSDRTRGYPDVPDQEYRTVSAIASPVMSGQDRVMDREVSSVMDVAIPISSCRRCSVSAR